MNQNYCQQKNEGVVICKYDESFGYILTSDYSLVREIWESLSFWVPGYQFMPAYKRGFFDGKIKLMDLNTRRFPIGLAQQIYVFCRNRVIPCQIENAVLDCFTRGPAEEEIELFIDGISVYSRGERIYPREDQRAAIIRAITAKRCVNICPTSFGKSLAITFECLWYVAKGLRCLIVVPTKDLVDQFANDIADYATREDGSKEKWFPNIQRIYAGNTKELKEDTEICISTWQSLSKTEEGYMNQFDTIILDECFDGNSNVLTPFGYKKIKDIQVGDKVINYNEQLGTFKEDEVVEVHKNLTSSHSEKMYELTFDNKKTIKVTGNHKFLTQRGWIRADELTEEDDIVEFNSYAENIYNRSKLFYNSILQEYNQNLRIVSCNKNLIELNNGIILTDKKYIQKFRSRLRRKNKEWKEKVDEWILDENIAQDIKNHSCSFGGQRVWEIHRDKLYKYASQRQPWNKGMKGRYHQRPMTEEGRKNHSLCKIGEKNGMYGRKHTEECKKKSSEYIKSLIKDGLFTPNTNNRNTHFNVEYNGCKYRSSWELLFHYNNPSSEYEKLRIPYTLDNKEHIYIVDFIDNVNKCVIEIKPSTLLQDEKSQVKITALKEWCQIHDYKLCILCENEIKELRDKTDLSVFDEDVRRKLEKL